MGKGPIMTSFYGLNIDALATKWEPLYPLVERLDPALLVIQVGDGSGVNLARNLKALAPHATIMLRWPDDATLHEAGRNLDPSLYVKWRASAAGYDPDFILYLENEPVTEDERLVQWQCGAMDAGVQIGQPIAAGGWGVGWPPREKVTGVFRPVFEQAAAQGHRLHFHEYGAFNLRAAPNTINGWLLGAVRDVLAAYPQLPPRDVFLTEIGLDAITQAPGSNSWRRLGLSERAYADELTCVFAEVYRELGIGGAAIFEYCEQGEWFDKGYSVAGANDLLAALAVFPYGAWQKGAAEPLPDPGPEPEPDPTPEDRLTLTRGELVNLRTSLTELAAGVEETLAMVDWVLAGAGR